MKYMFGVQCSELAFMAVYNRCTLHRKKSTKLILSLEIKLLCQTILQIT